MPKMRLAWYAGASTALAAGVITSAFYQRANFYSAMVYLAQSNLCLMILVNLIFLVYGSFMYSLQRLCFGQLRPVEIEQLYEKAWFAVTETCLAMTVFREEVGAFFLVMFTALITGKVWGWIGEGRVEILEQQPPANPRLFHTRLSISLLTSVIYNFLLLHYSVNTVVQQARPDMMVMFLFEFAVLAISSVHTSLRYILSLVEQRVVKAQTQQRLEQRRSEIRAERNEILRRRELGEVTEGETEEALPREDDIDEMDIEVPGWESKGQWVLSLDLVADFLKLCIYAAFFFVLLFFYGLPIHIMRDLFMTTRSFVKRLGALLRYRQALRDMNKYPDATEEELSREDTCIICREEMHPWDPANPGQVERSRPKKLPCGHILHFGCLKSWLERQQVCPTCRSSVVVDGAAAPRNRDAMAFRIPGLNGQNQNQAAPANGAAPGVQAGPNGQPPPGQQPAGNGGNIRMFNLGPIRLGFAQGGPQEMQEMAQRMGVGDVVNIPHAPQTPQVQQEQNTEINSMDAIRAQLIDIEQRIHREMRTMQNAQSELQVFNLLFHELNRIRQLQQLGNPTIQAPTLRENAPTVPTPGPSATAGIAPPPPTTGPVQLPQLQQQPVFPLPHGQVPLPQVQHIPPMAQVPNFAFPQRLSSPSMSRYGGASYTTAIPAGSPDLPEGVVIPPGWSLLPLQRYADGGHLPPGSAAPAPVPASLQVQLQDILQPFAQQSPPPVPPPTSTHTNISSEANSAPGLNGSGVQQEVPRTGIQQGENSTSVLGAQQREPPAVAAPTPIMPNWGGSAQLFGGGNGMPFGLQQAPSSRSTSAQNDAPTEPHEGSSVAEQRNEVGGASDEGTNGSTSKGKAPATTVEDADDDE